MASDETNWRKKLTSQLTHTAKGFEALLPKAGKNGDASEVASVQPLRDTKLFCFGFHPWKKGYTARYLALDGKALFVRTAQQALALGCDSQSRLIVWGMRDVAAVHGLSARFGIPIWRMEDGFLRSLGLGSDRYAPASLVLDREGIYYDPTRPSELETILQFATFQDKERARARALRESIVGLGLSKYNVGDRTAKLPKPPPGKRVVLVPGQVEDDASIRLGCQDVRTNADLLERARVAHPNAFIVFKPHPDVVSGNREGAVPPAIQRLADAVVVDAPLPACLNLAHEVHTMTSLVGLEALLRGLEVHVYGQPFYSGWGLTVDRHVCSRRTRRLQLDELVASAYLRYPRYMHPVSGEPTTPEVIVAWLRDQMQKGGNRPVRTGWALRKTRKAINAVRGTLLNK